MNINSGAQNNQPKKVWDLPTRLFHWLLVIGIFANQLWLEDEWHRYVGYSILGLITFRIVWGFIGSPPSRWKTFLPSYQKIKTYISAIKNGNHPYFESHNPLASLMILALLCQAVALGATGYLLTTDTYFGSDTLEQIHEWQANALWIFIALHIFGALYESRQQKINLIASMIHGYKDHRKDSQ